MKKLTKSSLEELAQTMPVLSEQEQSMYVGGDIYIMDARGNLLRTDPSSTAHGLFIQGMEAGDSGVYTDLKSGVMLSEETYSVKGESGTVTEKQALIMQGPDLDVSLFEFMAEHTIVEWGMSYNKGENGGYMDTTHEKNVVSHKFNPNKYDSFIHNHAGGTGPSPDDMKAFDRFGASDTSGNGYETYTIYNEQTRDYEEYKKIEDEWRRDNPS